MNYPYVVFDTQACVNECPSGYKTRPDLNQCVDSCPTIGYYEINDRCIACASVCNTCFGDDSNQCLSCASGQLFFTDLNTCVSSCPEFSYREGDNCSNCVTSCATCSGTGVGDCLTCRPEFPYRDLGTNECLSACKPG